MTTIAIYLQSAAYSPIVSRSLMSFEPLGWPVKDWHWKRAEVVGLESQRQVISDAWSAESSRYFASLHLHEDNQHLNSALCSSGYGAQIVKCKECSVLLRPAWRACIRYVVLQVVMLPDANQWRAAYYFLLAQ